MQCGNGMCEWGWVRGGARPPTVHFFFYRLELIKFACEADLQLFLELQQFRRGDAVATRTLRKGRSRASLAKTSYASHTLRPGTVAPITDKIITKVKLARGPRNTSNQWKVEIWFKWRKV